MTSGNRDSSACTVRAQRPGPLAVHNAHLQDAALPAGGQIVGHEGSHLSGQERVQIQRAAIGSSTGRRPSRLRLTIPWRGLSPRCIASPSTGPEDAVVLCYSCGLMRPRVVAGE